MKLEFNRITKSYGSNIAVNEFSAVLTPGVYALLGPNGSGKSTLMNVLTDNLKADSGSITYAEADGKDEDVLKMGIRFREKLGFMPQYPGLYPNFTVERFMWYMAALKGIDKKTAKKQISDILRAVELDDVPHRKIGALSGGMKQRLALAQAVLGDPDILILDEPTAGLDPKQRISIRNFISGIAFDKIVVIATHVVSDIEFMAKNIIMLKKGVVIDNAPPDELLSKMHGKVWNVICESDEVGRMQKAYKVINMIRDDTTGTVKLRIISESIPAERAETVAPTLEDYYLFIFGESGN